MRDTRDQCVLVVVVGLPRIKIFLIHFFFDLGHVSIGFEVVTGDQLIVKILFVLIHLISLELLFTRV